MRAMIGNAKCRCNCYCQVLMQVDMVGSRSLAAEQTVVRARPYHADVDRARASEVSRRAVRRTLAATQLSGAVPRSAPRSAAASARHGPA
jgi:hypothetical protein